MKWFVIKIAIYAGRARKLIITIPMLGFINDMVDITIADPDPIENSVTIKNFFFLFNDFCAYL